MSSRRLSSNFTLDEMTASQTAARRGLNNTPTALVEEELERLVLTILQPLRDKIGRPLVISSGYRSPSVNSSVGGSRESAHVFGRAADISVPGMPTQELARFIVGLSLPFDQLINEFDSWIHIAIPMQGIVPRREQLTARRSPTGATLYTKGI